LVGAAGGARTAENRVGRKQFFFEKKNCFLAAFATQCRNTFLFAMKIQLPSSQWQPPVRLLPE
jgi:hypothetical protein